MFVRVQVLEWSTAVYHASTTELWLRLRNSSSQTLDPLEEENMQRCLYIFPFEYDVPKKLHDHHHEKLKLLMEVRMHLVLNLLVVRRRRRGLARLDDQFQNTTAAMDDQTPLRVLICCERHSVLVFRQFSVWFLGRRRSVLAVSFVMVTGRARSSVFVYYSFLQIRKS